MTGSNSRQDFDFPSNCSRTFGEALGFEEKTPTDHDAIRSNREPIQFAEVSGFSQQYISSLERGRRNPTVVTLYELATALGVSHMELVRPRRGG